jgi:medium-chain acyl-[acyl-carrier-protein] hydrolase
VIATNNNSWVTCLRSNAQVRLRLFCFPYAGGAASIFRAWPDALPPSIQVCPIQLPGRENRLREPVYTRLEPLVQALTPALQPYLDMPYAFFGHSLGALIAFEIIRIFIRQNSPGPIHLFVSGHTAPQVPDKDPPIHQLSKPEFIKVLGRLNGTPKEVLQNAELMELLIPLLYADFTINETYVYAAGEPLDCPISAFGGLQDDQVNRYDIAAWRDQTRGAFTLRMLPGDHFFLHSARSLLLRTIAQDLAQSMIRINAQDG